MKKPNNVVRIPCKLDINFFIFWFNFLRPFHKLTDREISIIACITKYRYELSKVIKDDTILNEVTFNEETKKKIRTECGVSAQHFNVVISKLKKAGMIIDNKVNPKFIPNIIEEEQGFQLLIYFDFNDIKVDAL